MIHPLIGPLTVPLTIIHCSLFFLSCLLVIWLRILWWPSHCSYLGWAVSAWTMNPWWTLLAFKIDLAQSGHSFNEGYSLDLHLKFGDLNETMFFVFFFNGKLCAAEADISWLLIATMGQALKTLQFPYCHSLAYFIRSSQPGTSYNSTPLCFNGDSRLQIFKFPSPNRDMGYFFILWKPSSRARKYII